MEMQMTWFVAYVTVFVGGPVVMLLLIYPAPTWRRFVIGCLAVMALIGAAVLAARTPGELGLLALGAMWLAWVVMVAMCVQAVRLRNKGASARRWSATVGAMATAIPWLGLSLARMVAG